MNQGRGLSWDHKIGTNKATALIAVLAVFASLLVTTASPAIADDSRIDVIVRETVADSDVAERVIIALDGVVGDHLSIIGGFTASLPESALDALRTNPAVASVTVDSTATDLTAGWQDATGLGTYIPNQWMGSMLHVGYQLGVDAYWSAGYTGTGIGVALIDTGVVPVEGLTLPGKVVNGADLSFESQSDTFRYLDTYGHGTHLAGIISGRDAAAPADLTINNAESYFVGVAPDSHIVNVKVAGHDGAVDVSQVIAALDWVVEHKSDHNIRIVNLAYGTDSTQDPRFDPLAYAAEQAWKAGLVVVVASGNDGNSSAVRNPATNPYVLTVGALDGYRLKGKNTQPIPDFSSCGVDRTVDLVAPGSTIVSLRNPGSVADVENPEARVADRFFVGSGTSQAAAAAAGAAALVLDRNPEFSPDQVKATLVDGADSFKKVSDVCQGAGKIDLYDSWWTSVNGAVQNHPQALGTGSLEDARGSDHLEVDGVVLEGEQDIFGNTWDGESWAAASASGTSWVDGEWNGTPWTGSGWTGLSWSGLSWSGLSWTGLSWSGLSWSGLSWSGLSWSGLSWTGLSWSGLSWSGLSWSGLSWSGDAWS